MKIDYKSLLFWILPILFSFLFELFFTDFRGYNFKNLIENGLALSMILVFLSLISENKLKTYIAKLFYIAFVISIALESSYFYIFNSFFSSSAIYIVLETNYLEASEFLESYVNAEILIFLIASLILLIFFSLKKYKPVLDFTTVYIRLYKIIYLGIVFFILIFTNLYLFNFPFQVINGSSEYLIEIEKYENFNVQNSIGNFENVEFKGNSGDHIFVLIIGESTSRNHLGIYDFYRPTTPKLSKRKADLLIYQDVISSESHTIESLQSVLSLDNFSKEIESTLIQLMNQAGFKTFWLSNQPPIGIYDTLLSKVAKASDAFVFTNSSSYGNKTPYDEVLLPHLDLALNDDAKKKFIVLHLLATHSIYKLRYPKEFDFFISKPKTKFESKSNFKKINAYHNSITYVDFIVDEVIKRVEAQNQISSVIFLSDHGEEVFTDYNFFGHNDLYFPTRSMYEIPFVVWLSPKYKSLYTLDFDPHRPYSIEYLLHSISDLSKVDFNTKDFGKSIFSKQFKPSKRIISKRFNYDEYFKPKKDSLSLPESR